MAFSAILRKAPLSPQKGRLVADMIRNQPVGAALQTLAFTPKKGAVIIKKLLESAVANAENLKGVDIDDLFVWRISVGDGPRLKRMSPRAKGRGNRIIKRSCHIFVELSVVGEDETRGDE